MTKADEVRLELIKELVGEYVAAYDDLADPPEIAETLMLEISEIISDSEIIQNRDNYLFPELVDVDEDDGDGDTFAKGDVSNFETLIDVMGLKNVGISETIDEDETNE